jgi:hypothetical protein
MYGWDRDWTEKGESCFVVTKGREGRSRGCIREDLKEGFRKEGRVRMWTSIVEHSGAPAPAVVVLGFVICPRK